ncbi:membrane protein [Advenella kashmirensis W13003]|uniref:Membrane protein n=1 Tax=Advenella kashmirensis W13003 TaxID=1424334 RepID=V8QU89_9BURK|nr:YbfB/YjiJ family MFS transporter [Advenella kashmirensis]ETF03197.1 membrane protein [Advenella kashmirensis W13003]
MPQQSTAGTQAIARALPEWRMLMAGLCASLVGIGLARFAYTPLLPAIINAQWFSASTAAYLGAANLTGYLAGALLGAGVARRIGTIAALRLMMALATAAFFACAIPVSFVWFFTWRFFSGISGGALMVLAATSILPFIRPSRRGTASGVIFMGVGLGVIASGTLVPALLHIGLVQTWTGLGLLSLVLTIVSWSSWPSAGKGISRERGAKPSVEQTPAEPRTSGAPAGAPAIDASAPARQASTRSLNLLYLVYGLNAVGLVAHMVFLVDYVARGLGWGVAAGSVFWVIYGIGAAVGPLVCGFVADRIGYALALRGALLLQVVVVAIPILTVSPVLLGVSSFFVGAFTPGIVPLTLGRLREMLPHLAARQQTAWGRATTSFALMQAAAAYAMSFVFDYSNGQYRLLFILAALTLLIAFAIQMVASRKEAND